MLNLVCLAQGLAPVACKETWVYKDVKLWLKDRRWHCFSRVHTCAVSFNLSLMCRCKTKHMLALIRSVFSDLKGSVFSFGQLLSSAYTWHENRISARMFAGMTKRGTWYSKLCQSVRWGSPMYTNENIRRRFSWFWRLSSRKFLSNRMWLPFMRCSRKGRRATRFASRVPLINSS